MNPKLHAVLLIIREFIRAHRERGDDNRVQLYIPRIENLANQIQTGVFQKLPAEEQIGVLRALRSEYFGRGHVFGLLSPKYIEPEFGTALLQAIKEYIEFVGSTG